MAARPAAGNRRRWFKPLRRMVLVAALLAAAPASAAAAQQPDSTRSARADTAATPRSAAVPVGPRRDDRWQPYRPDLVPGRSRMAALPEGGMQTIRISTLALVLIVVIVVLLVVR